MANFHRKRDLKINGKTSAYFASLCKPQYDENTGQLENTGYNERKKKVESLLQDDYWTEYFREHNDVRGNKGDYLAEQSSVNQNLEQMATYMLQAPDVETELKKIQGYSDTYVKYNIFKTKQENMKVPLDNGAENHVLDIFLDEQQYYLEKGYKFKESMMNQSERAKGYKHFYYASAKDRENYQERVRTRLIESQVKIRKRIDEIEQEVQSVDVKSSKRAELNIELHDLNQQDKWIVRKIKTLMYYTSNLQNYVKEDVLACYMSEIAPIDFKHVHNNKYKPEILNFFDYFDIVDDLDNSQIVLDALLVGTSDYEINHLEDIIYGNAVYSCEPQNSDANMVEEEALINEIGWQDTLREQMNYYVFKAQLTKQQANILTKYRHLGDVPKKYSIIAQDMDVNRSYVYKVILRIVSMILLEHEKNVEVLTALKAIGTKNIESGEPITRVIGEEIVTVQKCELCGEVKRIDDFYYDKKARNGYKALCKTCFGG